MLKLLVYEDTTSMDVTIYQGEDPVKVWSAAANVPAVYDDDDNELPLTVELIKKTVFDANAENTVLIFDISTHTGDLIAGVGLNSVDEKIGIIEIK